MATHFIAIGVTVINHATSKIDWYQEGMFYSALVGWDMNALTGADEFEYNNSRYQILMAISNESATGTPPQSIQPGGITYLTENVPTQNPASILTALYTAEKDQLIAAQTERERVAAENARLAAAVPPSPANSTIWLRPKKGSRYMKAAAPETEGGDQ